MTSAQKQITQNKRIRGPNLAVFIPHIYGIPMEEAIRKADDAGLVIASNKRLDNALAGSEGWRNKRDGFICWTGTLIAFEDPGFRLGKWIEILDPDTTVRHLFPVPEEHRGKKDIVLVAEHPDFSLAKEGNDRIIQATEIGAVEMFPRAKDGWYLCDPKYGIPQGNTVSEDDPAARYIVRRRRRISLIVRCTDIDSGFGFRLVDLWSRLSQYRGVIVEAREK